VKGGDESVGKIPWLPRAAGLDIKPQWVEPISICFCRTGAAG